MQQNFPEYIKDEKDLEYYERYLINESSSGREVSSDSFKACLNKNIGKLVKVESIICNRLECRTGILLEVGAEHLIIKPGKNCVSTIIDLNSVKYITVIHDNDIRKSV